MICRWRSNFTKLTSLHLSQSIDRRVIVSIIDNYVIRIILHLVLFTKSKMELIFIYLDNRIVLGPYGTACYAIRLITDES